MFRASRPGDSTLVELTAWARGVLPVVSRPLVMAWLLTFCGVFLELPLSQLLYAPGSPPAARQAQRHRHPGVPRS